MAQIRPWFMPWRHPVHERLTADAAAALGFAPADVETLLQGTVDNDLCASPLGTYRRHWANDAQPTHCLRKREHTGPVADRQALAAATDFVLQATLAAWDAQAAGQRRRALFCAGKALHAVQDSYFHADRDYAGGGDITHVRAYIGPQADHDAAVDAGWDRQGRPSIQYREAARASLDYLRLLQRAFATPGRDAVAVLLTAFCAVHFRLRPTERA